MTENRHDTVISCVHVWEDSTHPGTSTECIVCGALREETRSDRVDQALAAVKTLDAEHADRFLGWLCSADPDLILRELNVFQSWARRRRA